MVSSIPRTRLILVRHGETLANREFRYIGTQDHLLSEQGQLQAEQLAEALSVLPIAAVYSSPLQRAYRTAESIAIRHALALQVLDGLREGSFGSWEGMSRVEVLARSLEDEQQLLAWERDPDVAPPGGESFVMICERVLTTVGQLAQAHVEQAIVLVSHVGVIKALLCAALAACRREQSSSHASRSSRAHILDGTSRDDEQKAVTARARAEMRAESTGRRPNLLH